MADTLTEAERAAIAAFPAERITRVPRGTSGLPLPRWVTGDGEGGRLVYATGPDGVKASRKAWARGAAALRRHEVAPELAARREAVARLTGEGVPAPEIARRLEVPVYSIHADLRALGLKAVPAAGVRGPDPAVTARRAEVARLTGDGVPAAEIATRLGLTEKKVRGDLRRLKIKPAPAGRPVPEDVAARRAEVARMTREGVSAPEIARRLGVPVARVRFDLARLGLKAAPAQRRKPAASGADWRRNVRTLLREGLGVEDIALRLRCDVEVARLEVRTLRAVARRA